jgi:hypothetical protein
MCPVSVTKVALTAAALIATAAAAGCSGGSARPVDFTGSHRRQIEARFSPDSNVSVIDSVLYGASSGAFKLEHTGFTLMTSCVEATGFKWPATEPTASVISAEVKPILKRLPLSQAKAHGYGFSDALPHLPSGDPVADYNAALSTSQQTAYAKVIDTCGARTSSALFADKTKYERLREDLQTKRIDFYTSFSAAPPVVALTGKWSSCMQLKGYRVKSISEAVQLAAATPEPANQGTSASPKTEFAVALADAGCRVETNYEAAYIDLFRNAESTFVFENEALLVELIQLRYGKLQGESP